MGVHTFTVTANITHIGREDGQPRYNMEYARWVAELQLEHLLAMQRAVVAFPARPLRATHTLAGVVHPLHMWQPFMPAVVEAAFVSVSDDEDEYPDDDDVAEGSDEGGTRDKCPCVGCDPPQTPNYS